MRTLLSTVNTRRLPNVWDLLALCLVLALIVFLGSAAKQMNLPFHLGNPLPISLAPSHLFNYALQTVFRMLLALLLSLLFTFTFATWAAKSPAAERIIIPVIDVLQSVPVLAFLSLTIIGFIKLFPNSLLGPQCACVFLIFTAQAWNMALSFYQSLKSVPSELTEAALLFQLSAWQRFWRVDVPFSLPALLWNTMMSMSASWFSLVASEAISVAGQNIALPGIGSYIAYAIHTADLRAVGQAILAMLVVIILYDQLLFRPLIAWSEKFKMDQTGADKTPRAWLIWLLQRTRVLRYATHILAPLGKKFIDTRIFGSKNTYHISDHLSRRKKITLRIWDLCLACIIAGALYVLGKFLHQNLTFDEIRHVFFLGTLTATRVFFVLLASSIIWVPIGVWIGLRPRVAELAQPIAQFLAAFPANVFFPVVVLLIVRYQLNVNIWTTPLMMLGTQWYILFNVVAGASAIPKDLRQAAANLGVTGWLWWKRLVLPAIFPYYITGAITAGGGAWNASLVTEVVTWGDTTLRATGLGAYVTEYTGDYVHTVLGVTTMCMYVFFLNRMLWRPLYRFATTRFQLN